MRSLEASVAGALGLARKGSFLRTFPVPLQTGHLDNIAISVTPQCGLFYDINKVNSSDRKGHIVIL